jgi:DNA-binding transcriptional MerR regulator
MPRKTDGSPLYGIGAVSRITGLTDHTIRVWERRYAAVTAARAPNGRRQYTEADVQKLALLRRLTENGIAISRVAGDTLDELRRRVDSLRELAADAEPRALRVAVHGDFLPRQLREQAPAAALDIRIADSSRERFAADLHQQSVDVIVLERPVLDAETLGEIRRHLEGTGAAKGVIVYSFGRSRDVDAAAEEGIVALRAPVGADELRDAATRSPIAATRVPRVATADYEAVTAPDLSAPVAARRFSPQQLANLSSTKTGVDCECPRHLAQLVSDLSAFEIYSDRCANHDDNEAALHRYLHRTTAEARALVEQALQKLADAEGLRY